MGRGRTPDSPALKVLKGSKSGDVAARAPSGRPEPPERFDDETKAQWHRLCDALESLGLLTPSHGFALGVYCGAYARLLAAEKALAEHGPLLVTTRGGTEEGDEGDVVIKSNPAAAIAAKCEATMLRVLTEFGLTSASAGRVKAKPGAKADALAEFLAKRKA